MYVHSCRNNYLTIFYLTWNDGQIIKFDTKNEFSIETTEELLLAREQIQSLFYFIIVYNHIMNF